MCHRLCLVNSSKRRTKIREGGASKWALRPGHHGGMVRHCPDPPNRWIFDKICSDGTREALPPSDPGTSSTPSSFPRFVNDPTGRQPLPPNQLAAQTVCPDGTREALPSLDSRTSATQVGSSTGIAGHSYGLSAASAARGALPVTDYFRLPSFPKTFGARPAQSWSTYRHGERRFVPRHGWAGQPSPGSPGRHVPRGRVLGDEVRLGIWIPMR